MRCPRTTQRPQRSLRDICSAASAASALIVVVAAAGCGKKGPPLPPLVRLPVAPANVTAQRHGDTVDISFTVPDANTDRTKPANIERVDVYAITAAASITDDQLLKRGTKVASVDVKSPKDPNAVVDEDERDQELEPVVGTGLDQGAAARVEESLTPRAFAPADLGKPERAQTDGGAGGPLIGPPMTMPARVYVAVGISSKGRKGPLSRRAAAPLIPPPSPPRDLRLSYTDREVDLSWSPTAQTSSDSALPSRPLGVSAPATGYNVYDVSNEMPQRINKDPLNETKAADPRIAWGEKRCYVVRAVSIVSGASVESESSPEICDTLKDTFAPAAPKGLRSVAGEGTISLIWDPNGEADMAGYLVFRGRAGAELQVITPTPIQETNFSDTVQPGIQYVYAVKAVDTAGNTSAFSERVDETARQ